MSCHNLLLCTGCMLRVIGHLTLVYLPSLPFEVSCHVMHLLMAAVDLFPCIILVLTIVSVEWPMMSTAF